MIDQYSKVTLHFSLELENGDVVDSNFDGQAPSFTMGDGSLLPGFEHCLLGLNKGDKKSFVVDPKGAFGEPNPENIQDFPRSDFDEKLLQENMVIYFTNALKHEIPALVKHIGEEQVTVDFNHPLAGKNIVFKVEIVDVQ